MLKISNDDFLISPLFHSFVYAYFGPTDSGGWSNEFTNVRASGHLSVCSGFISKTGHFIFLKFDMKLMKYSKKNSAKPYSFKSAKI